MQRLQRPAAAFPGSAPAVMDEQRLAEGAAGEDVDIGLPLHAVAAGQRADGFGALGREIGLVVGDDHGFAEIGEADGGRRASVKSAKVSGAFDSSKISCAR